MSPTFDGMRLGECVPHSFTGSYKRTKGNQVLYSTGRVEKSVTERSSFWDECRSGKWDEAYKMNWTELDWEISPEAGLLGKSVQN